jgi:hypothetical protein
MEFAAVVLKADIDALVLAYVTTEVLVLAVVGEGC